MAGPSKQKVVIVGAGPVGSLAALYAASRGDDVELYELRGDQGLWPFLLLTSVFKNPSSFVLSVRYSFGFLDLRDPSTIPLNFTKSINLALSERGINAMKRSEHTKVIDAILRDAIPMYGRMIHGKDALGKLWEAAQAYDVHGRAINSVDRAILNNALLDELDRTPNVKLFFNYKLTGADFRARKAWFERRVPEGANNSSKPKSQRASEIEVQFDFLIGADGAHSAT
ncbi:Kynurenine 3-monooxygenase, partial [Rasamsonia emersonii CBS 393.64]